MLDNNHKIMMDCGKFYVMRDVTQKPLLMHRIVEIVLAYLNCYAHVLLVMVFILLG